MTAAQSTGTTVITGVCRGSYVKVHSAALNELSGKTEYSMSVLIPKHDEATVNALRTAAATAVGEKWPDKSKRPANLRNPLRDGDAEKPNDEAYRDHYWINVKSKNRPGIVDKNLQPIMSESDFQSGDYCRVSVNAYAYDQKGNRGAAFGLNNVQVVSKGEPLGGAARAPEDDFGVFGGGDGADMSAVEDDMFS